MTTPAPHPDAPRILVVEDEPPIAMALEDGLGLEGYAVTVASNGTDGLAHALAEPRPDVILLDLRMPGMSGLDVLKRLRAEGVRTPVMILTARGAEADRVAGLECGADDYVVKPFSMAEVIARVRAHLRRDREYGTTAADEAEAASAAAEETVTFGDVQIDFVGHLGKKGETDLALSPLEMKILRLLWDERGRTVSRERFLREVWGYERLPVTRTVDFHMGRLRQKIEDDPKTPRHIKTHHGVGYRLEVD